MALASEPVKSDYVEPNRYSPQWFTSFLDSVSPDNTAQEVDAITHHLPRSRFPKLLDVGCGSGRIALPLIDLGYEVMGVDRDRRQLDRARDELGEREGRFIAIDLRDLSMLRGPFDGILSLWQSFGYFDAAINDTILGDMSDLLRPEGRLLFDLYHPGFFAIHAGARKDDRPGVSTITHTLAAGRLRSEIVYDDGAVDVMDFEVFSPDDLVKRAAKVDLELVQSCSWWDADSEPTSEVARYQMIFERI